MIKFLDLAKQYRGFKEEADQALAEVISNSAYIGGKHVDQFEKDFAAYHQAAHYVGVGNGTDALELVLEGLQLPAGSEAIVPANSFIATSEAASRSGLKVIFADCDPETYVLDLADLERRITPRTKVILAVHLYGHPCDMDPILALADKHALLVVEDCAQAHGSLYKGKMVGTFGVAGCFSFYPGKTLGAWGDGGAVITGDGKLAERVRMLANHGRTSKHAHAEEGRNSRLDGLQAAILGIKLKRLESWIQRRLEVADLYGKELSGIGQVVLPKRRDHVRQSYHLYVIRAERRDELKAFLGEKGIQTGIHYPVALPKLEAYRHLTEDYSDLFACRADSQLLSLPLGEHLEDDEVLQVARAVREFYGA